MQLLLGYAALDAAVAAVRQSAAELADGRREAASLVDRLLDGGWSGAAASSFGTAWEEWLAGEERVRSALDAIEAALTTTRRELATTDHDGSADLAWLTERLGG